MVDLICLTVDGVCLKCNILFSELCPFNAKSCSLIEELLLPHPEGVLGFMLPEGEFSVECLHKGVLSWNLENSISPADLLGMNRFSDALSGGVSIELLGARGVVNPGLHRLLRMGVISRDRGATSSNKTDEVLVVILVYVGSYHLCLIFEHPALFYLLRY